VASYKVPRDFVVVDKVPKSASGKILRRMLRETYKSVKTTETARALAATATLSKGPPSPIAAKYATPKGEEMDEEAAYARRYRQMSYGLRDWHGLVAKCGAAVCAVHKTKCYAFELLQGLLVESQFLDDGADLSDRCLLQLFRISVAVAGTRVEVMPALAPSPMPTGGGDSAGIVEQPRTAVLILGYAGSSPPLLRPVAALYQRLFPHWAVVLTTGPGILRNDPYAKRGLSEQLDRIIDELAPYSRIVVHCMSNNGHGQWAMLLHTKRASLAGRIAAIVYDSAVDRNLASTQSKLLPLPDAAIANPPLFHTSIVGSVVSALIAWQVTTDPPLAAAALKEKISVATSDYLTRTSHPKESWWPYHVDLDGFNVFDFTAQHEPPTARTLLLSGDVDDVISPGAVEEYAAFLRRIQPLRSVSHVALKGSHCQLHLTDSRAYESAINALVDAK